MAAPTTYIVLLVLSLAVMARANSAGALDEYWQKRAAKAEKVALASYNPNPDSIAEHTNKHVHIALNTTEHSLGSDNALNGTTRRNLRRLPNRGPCKATNPIDRCWRCQANWADDRKKLADCALGFGKKTVGGKFGKFYVVTDASDNDLLSPKPGTLRHAVTRTEPLWIIFSRSMVITLQQELMMASDKTIDARGVRVHIAHGCGLTLQFIQNVIIHGLRIHSIVPGQGGDILDSEQHHGIRTKSDGDGISIYGSSHVWIDHVSMSNCFDGLIDAIEGATAITISNSHFTRHNEVMLFGASDKNEKDVVMQITVAFNHFGKGLVQRMPRCRWGFFHVVNNDYTHWLMYAIGGSTHPTIVSQGNRFIAPPNQAAKEVTKRDYATADEWKKWSWRSEKDLMMNGAFFVEGGQAVKSRPDMITAKPGAFVARLTRNAGLLDCKPNKPC